PVPNGRDPHSVWERSSRGRHRSADLSKESLCRLSWPRLGPEPLAPTPLHRKSAETWNLSHRRSTTRRPSLKSCKPCCSMLGNCSTSNRKKRTSGFLCFAAALIATRPSMWPVQPCPCWPHCSTNRSCAGIPKAAIPPTNCCASAPRTSWRLTPRHSTRPATVIITTMQQQRATLDPPTGHSRTLFPRLCPASTTLVYLKPI